MSTTAPDRVHGRPEPGAVTRRRRRSARLAGLVAVGAVAGCSGGASSTPDAPDGPGAPDGGAACTFTASVLASVGDGLPGGPEVNIAGAATVLDAPPVAVRFDDDRIERFGFDAPGDDALVFGPGERLWVELAARGPFWVNYQIEVYALDPSGGPGELRLAVWWGERRLGPVSGWTLEIEDSDCDATDPCGRAVGSNLRAVAPSGGAAVVAPGTSVDLDGYRVTNGRSWRYQSAPTCTDTPFTWSGVSVVRR